MTGVLGRLAAGTAAGVVGTLGMDLVWYRRYRAGGGEDDFLSWEFGSSPESFEDAGPPAKFAQRIAATVGAELPDRSAGTATNVMHWLTGTGYAAMTQTVIDRHRNVAASALATGVGAFLNSYAVLGALGLYEPIWEYDRDTLADDLRAHLVFGAASAATYRLLTLGRTR